MTRDKAYTVLTHLMEGTLIERKSFVMSTEDGEEWIILESWLGADGHIHQRPVTDLFIEKPKPPKQEAFL